jgi:phosphoribosylformylglycinamidine synthase
VRVRVENLATPWTNAALTGQCLRLAIAHGEGNYVADPETLRNLRQHRRILLPVLRRHACASPTRANPNGSRENIAGICNAAGQLSSALMPHPERACDPRLGSVDGRVIFQSILTHLAARKRR